MFAIEKTPVERLMLTALGATLAVLLLAGGIAWNIAVPLDTFKSVDHSREVMAEFDELRFKIDRAESQQWAYFLTKESTFIAQRDLDLEDLKPVFRRLGLLTPDNLSQQERVRQLQALVDKRAGLFHEAQALFDARGFGAAQATFNEGRKVGADTRRIMFEAEQDEKALLETRKESEAVRVRIILGGIALLLAFLAMLYVRARGLLLRRSTAELASRDE